MSLKRPTPRERQLTEALKAVKADILDEKGLNVDSIVDTVWHSMIETLVDFIDAAIDPEGPQ